jgi:hypothetical protein
LRQEYGTINQAFKIIQAHNAARFFSPQAVVDFFRTNYGPASRAFASLDESGQKTLNSELVDLWSSNNKSSNGVTKVDAEYLEVIARRS